jgi:hypothetical protein
MPLIYITVGILVLINNFLIIKPAYQIPLGIVILLYGVFRFYKAVKSLNTKSE